ncbi:MAG: transcriptional regulator [Clostridia bacterium]|nr:transcriptional regulator [Clostridia bacterium]
MNREKYGMYRRNLLDKKKELKNYIESTEDSGLSMSLGESISELSTYDNHPADIGDELYERSKDLSLRDNAVITVNKIDEALEAMEEGKYGLCKMCGKDIDEDRLSLLPESLMCVECSREKERQDYTSPRPVEEEILTPPFGGAQDDFGDPTEGQIIFDGEDSWQAVERYGTSDSPQDQPESLAYPDLWFDQDEDRGAVEDVESVVIEEEEGVFYEDPGGESDSPLGQ